MGKGKDSKFIIKGKRSFPKENSAFLASRSETDKGKVSYPDHPDALLAKRGEPEKGSVTFNDNRYK